MVLYSTSPLPDIPQTHQIKRGQVSKFQSS